MDALLKPSPAAPHRAEPVIDTRPMLRVQRLGMAHPGDLSELAAQHVSGW